MTKNKAVYAPGELAKVRDKLGVDEGEAKRMAQLLGGEVGFERNEDQETVKNKPKRPAAAGEQGRSETAEVKAGQRKPSRRIELLEDEEALAVSVRRPVLQKSDPNDDPNKPLKMGYFERVKMDKYMGQVEFGIKSSLQVLISTLSILGPPADLVSPSFVNRRLNEYYKRIEQLVTSIRSLLPRNNLRRNEKFKRVSPFAYSIIDTMRYWNIDQLSSNLSRIQARPRTVKIQDLQEILRDVYKPLYILENLDPETHIKGAFKLLYKILYLENTDEAKNKYQEQIRSALTSYGIIRRDIRFQLYPLLMKLLSDRYIPYELFFAARKNRICAFLQVEEANRINPSRENAEMAAMLAKDAEESEEVIDEEKEITTEDVFDESALEEPISEEEKAKKQQGETEKKALERGLATLEAIFPQAGWDRIDTFPDLFPYFSGIFKFKKSFELIAPTDPLQQAIVLMRILEELFFGLRYVRFGTIMGNDGPEPLAESISGIVNDWQKNYEEGYGKEYLPRLDEYCRLLENTAESRTSNYARRLLNELFWIKRLFFFPYYRFESIMPPPFQKNAITAIYPEVRRLRRYLTAIAGAIDQGNKLGGAEQHAPCEGVDNPWDNYAFEIPNPVSIRLNALLSPKRRNNASLIFFSLAVTVVLDHLLNNENSWAYGQKGGYLYRSERDEGIRPLFGVETKVNADDIFKQVLKRKQAAAQAGQG